MSNTYTWTIKELERNVAIVNCNANNYLTIGSNASINFFHGANHSKGAFHLLG